MYDVVTMGSATVDVFVKTDNELIDIRSKTIERALLAYPLGSKILINDLQFMIGGGGTNTAVSFSRLGLKTAFLGCIGKDTNGQKILQLLGDEHIDFIGVQKEVKSNYSIILDSIEHDRTILTYRDASDKLDYSDVNLDFLKTRWIYSSSLMGLSYGTLERIVEYAHKNNIKFAFNSSSYLAKKGIDFLKNLISNTDILILNYEEAKLLIGKATKEELLENLRQYGPQTIVITHGRHGVIALINNHIYNVDSRNVQIKETTGAGDAFASAFVAGVIMEKDPELCLKLGMVNAESVIQNYGAKNILLSKKDAFQLVEHDNRQITCNEHTAKSQQNF